MCVSVSASACTEGRVGGGEETRGKGRIDGTEWSESEKSVKQKNDERETISAKSERIK